MTKIASRGGPAHCHAIQWFFCRFFAAEKWRRSHRGRTRSDQSRRRPGKNPSIAIARLGLRAGTGVRVEGLRYDLPCKASSRLSSCTCFSSSCSAEVPSIFFPRSASSRAAHHQSYTRPMYMRVSRPQASSLQICSRQTQFLKVSPEQVSETGEARLAAAHNSTCQSTRKVFSSKTPAYIYCERGRDR